MAGWQWRQAAVDVVDRLCPSRSHGWHIATFTYLPGSLLHRHGHSDFHVGGCVQLHQAESDGCPASLAQRAYPLLWPLCWRDCISIKYWNWQALDNFRHGFLHFPDTSLSFRWAGVICFISWQRTAFIHWCLYFLVCRGSHLVRVAEELHLHGFLRNLSTEIP